MVGFSPEMSRKKNQIGFQTMHVRARSRVEIMTKTFIAWIVGLIKMEFMTIVWVGEDSAVFSSSLIELAACKTSVLSYPSITAPISTLPRMNVPLGLSLSNESSSVDEIIQSPTTTTEPSSLPINAAITDGITIMMHSMYLRNNLELVLIQSLS